MLPASPMKEGADMKLFKALIVLFVLAFIVDATMWHGYYRTRFGHRLHTAATGITDGSWASPQ
jgi:hypothetical protein